MNFENTLAFARTLDHQDKLKEYRNRFFIPVHKGKDSIYFTGNSLRASGKIHIFLCTTGT